MVSVETTCRMSIFLPQIQLQGKTTELWHLEVPSASGHQLQALQEGKEDPLMPHGEALSVQVAGNGSHLWMGEYLFIHWQLENETEKK